MDDCPPKSWDRSSCCPNLKIKVSLFLVVVLCSSVAVEDSDWLGGCRSVYCHLEVKDDRPLLLEDMKGGDDQSEGVVSAS